MKTTELQLMKPCPRGLLIYYAVAIVATLLCAAGIVASSGWMDIVAIETPLMIAAFVAGLGVIGIVVCIHVEMLGARYEFSEDTVRARWGLLINHDENIQLAAVRSIKVSQGPVQRLFGTGDVILYTTSSDILVLFDLDRPSEKKDFIWSLAQAAPGRRGQWRASQR